MQARRAVAVCFVVFALLAVVGVARAELTYEGSSSIGKALLPELARAFEAKTGIKFGKIGSTDSDAGFNAVIASQAVIGGLSRLQSAKELEAGLANRVIGYDAVVVYVQPDSSIKDLTTDQLKGIFTGKITNWQEVGGPDLSIATVLKKDVDVGGTARQFRELALVGEPFASGTVTVPGYKEAVAYVAANPAAITFASLVADEKVARYISVDGVAPSRENLAGGAYPLGRPYLLIYRDDPNNADLAKFLDFVFSEEGQAIVKKHAIPVMALSN